LAIIAIKRFDPIKWPDSTEQDYRSRMAPKVVQNIAYAILRRRKRKSRERNNVHIEFFQSFGVETATEINDELIVSIESWISRHRKGWVEECQWARENGIWAHQQGHIEAARRWAERAALFGHLSRSRSSQSAIPVLAYGFGILADEIARVRGIGIDGVQKAKARFAAEVRMQAAIEEKSFAGTPG
jgi:hypothetical protein